MNATEWTPLLAWLCNYLVHSSVLLSLAWLADAAGLLRNTRSREFAWRLALVGGLATATVHVFAPGVSLVERDALSPNTAARAIPASRAWIEDTVTPIADSVRSARPVEPPQAQRASHLRFDLPFSRLVLAAWLLGALLLSLRIVRTAQLAARELRGRERLSSGELHARLARLCRRSGAARVPRLSVADNLPGPVTLPGGEICLPRWAMNELPPRTLDAMLAHELAHVRRGDPLMLLGVTLLKSLLFLQPLNHLAHRRLAALAELNADVFAAQLTRNPRALAEALAHCARQLQAAPATPHALRTAVAMTTRRSPLIQRVERLLGDTVMKDQHVSKFVRVLGIAAMLAAVLMLPAFGPAAKAESGTHIVVNESDNASHMKIEIGRPGYFLHVETDGEVTFTETEDRIASLEQGGSIAIREKRGGVLHELAVTNDGDELERAYSRNDERMPLDDAARAWLAEAIPAVLRNTAINADKRIARLHERGGIAAVLEDMRQISSDHALTRYTVILANKYRLDDSELRLLLDMLSSLGSDFALRNVLAAIVSNQSLNASNQLQLLEVASSIGSDFEAAELATLVPAKLVANAANLPAWRGFVGGIGSDFEQRRALAPMFEHELPTAWRIAALRLAAEGIGSDFELRALLEYAAPHVTRNELLVEYLAALDEIGSDFEARQAVVALVEKGRLDARGYLLLLDALDGIGSDFEQLQALEAIARTMPREDALVQEYRELAEDLASHERGRALHALD